MLNQLEEVFNKYQFEDVTNNYKDLIPDQLKKFNLYELYKKDVYSALLKVYKYLDFFIICYLSAIDDEYYFIDTIQIPNELILENFTFGYLTCNTSFLKKEDDLDKFLSKLIKYFDNSFFYNFYHKINMKGYCSYSRAYNLVSTTQVFYNMTYFNDPTSVKNIDMVADYLFKIELKHKTVKLNYKKFPFYQIENTIPYYKELENKTLDYIFDVKVPNYNKSKSLLRLGKDVGADKYKSFIKTDKEAFNRLCDKYYADTKDYLFKINKALSLSFESKYKEAYQELKLFDQKTLLDFFSSKVDSYGLVSLLLIYAKASETHKEFAYILQFFIKALHKFCTSEEFTDVVSGFEMGIFMLAIVYGYYENNEDCRYYILYPILDIFGELDASCEALSNSKNIVVSLLPYSSDSKLINMILNHELTPILSNRLIDFFETMNCVQLRVFDKISDSILSALLKEVSCEPISQIVFQKLFNRLIDDGYIPYYHFDTDVFKGLYQDDIKTYCYNLNIFLDSFNIKEMLTKNYLTETKNSIAASLMSFISEVLVDEPINYELNSEYFVYENDIKEFL